MKHTRSMSGRTHRLTHHENYVELRYAQAPRFNDLVQGDLIRKYRATYQLDFPVGVLPTHIDPELDAPEHERGQLALECFAATAIKAMEWEPDYRPTQDEVATLLRAVIKVDRAERDNS